MLRSGNLARSPLITSLSACPYRWTSGGQSLTAREEKQMQAAAAPLIARNRPVSLVALSIRLGLRMQSSPYSSSSSLVSSNSNHNPVFTVSTGRVRVRVCPPNRLQNNAAAAISERFSSETGTSFAPSTAPTTSESEEAPLYPQPCNSNNSINAHAHVSFLIVISFYKFADFPDHANLRRPLKELCQQLRVSGGIILAAEGINGSICGTRESVESVLQFIQTDNRLKGLRLVESPVSLEEEAIHHGHSCNSPLAAGEDAPFRWDHVRVKLKKEIVTLGLPTISPIRRVGKYVCPMEWNTLISDPDTVVIDVRNDYETRIGKFRRAVDPHTTAFREFPSWVEDQFQPAEENGQRPNVEANDSDKTAKEQSEIQKSKTMPPRIAMYCTGGIRCEKASSYLLSQGFKEVYHLEGGILRYLEEVPKTQSLWEGECFVFDKRVSVDHGLVQGNYKLCYGCKQPVSDADMGAPEWEYGVTCPYCYSSKSEEEKERARARQNQFQRWGIIGGPHKGRRPPTSETDRTEG